MDAVPVAIWWSLPGCCGSTCSGTTTHFIHGTLLIDARAAPTAALKGLARELDRERGQGTISDFDAFIGTSSCTTEFGAKGLS